MAERADATPRPVVHANPVTQQGYTMIPNAILFRSDLGPIAKLIYGYLAHLSWKNTGMVAATREVIAGDLNISVKQVTTAIRELATASVSEGDDGSETLVKSLRRGQGLPNQYVLRDPLPRKDDPDFLPNSEGSPRDPTERPIRPFPARARQDGQEPKGYRKANGVAEATPPKLAKIDGRDVAFDALRDACSIDEDDPHGARETATALNGKDGIRAMFWAEFVKWAEEQGHPERVGEAREEPERFERALAAVVARKAARYRRRFPGADVTPTALRKWWLRLDSTRVDRSRLSSEDIVRVDELAEREGISFEDALDRLAGAVA